jgi:uracil-DNA glycosylase
MQIILGKTVRVFFLKNSPETILLLGLRQSNLSAMTSAIDLPQDWLDLLEDLFQTPPMNELRSFLRSQYKLGSCIYPPSSEVFKAFHLTSVKKVKVVILGQDPYHGPKQAHGLSFSVPDGVTPPPSLKNIFKELTSDLGCSTPQKGNLSSWAQQGVLLLNSVLTVQAHQPASHQGKGWEFFTDQVIERLNSHHHHLIFVLWGSYAIKKKSLISCEKHLILQSPHPSPLSAHRGFFGSKPFSQINEYLIQHNKTPIQWNLPS